jgi:hypothetical protein
MDKGRKIPQTKNAPQSKVEKKPEPRIMLDLPLSAVDIIYQALAERPWKQVRNLQTFIEQQVSMQLAPKQEGDKEVPGPAPKEYAEVEEKVVS